jgi:hypothetical protein
MKSFLGVRIFERDGRSSAARHKEAGDCQVVGGVVLGVGSGGGAVAGVGGVAG